MCQQQKSVEKILKLLSYIATVKRYKTPLYEMTEYTHQTYRC